METRKQLFEKNAYSIKKILSPINASVKSSYGKEAKEAIDVAIIIAKIRGTKAKSTKSTEQATVSQSYLSFSSRTQFFADLLAYLTNFGTNYNPSNNRLLIMNLEKLHTDATLANHKVMESYSLFILNNNARISSYDALSQIAIRIKDGVKAQYGQNSTEYLLIKSLKI